jgi:hypothetical protein
MEFRVGHGAQAMEHELEVTQRDPRGTGFGLAFIIFAVAAGAASPGGAHQIAGDYAASAVSSTCKPGYQRRKVEANSWLSVWTRACNNKCAPRLVHCMDWRFTNRLLSTKLTVDSTNAVAIVSPRR